jgi:hypothetical protein
MRPRFLIAVIEAAISNAIDRRHDRVEEEDCKSAIEQNSSKVLNDFSYELRDVSGASEDVLNSLVGSTRLITKGEILERFEKAKIIKKRDVCSSGCKLWRTRHWKSSSVSRGLRSHA